MSVKLTIDNEIYSYETFLTAEATAGVSTLTVGNIKNFAINQILLIGELGDENSEIIKTHTATAPTGSTITLLSALTLTHPAYTKVRVMVCDQVEFSHTTTLTGTKTVMATSDIQANSVDTIYVDTTYNSGYYFTRFKNSITNKYSDYGDAIPYAGYGSNTVGFVIQYALKRNKLETFTGYIDYQFCLDEINSCLRFITGKLKGWTKLLITNYVTGVTERGVYKIAMPSDIWEDKGQKSVLNVRIGPSIVLESKTISEMEEEMESVVVTEVTTAAAVGQTTLAIDNSYDFPDTGSVDIFISGTLYNITYTGVTRSLTAGVLTGIPASGTGSITVIIPADTNVWYKEKEGKPEYFTVDGDGNLVIWPVPSALYDNLNVFMDYWTGPGEVDTDSDTLDAFRYDCVKHWLTWAIRMQLKNDGVRNFTDGDYIQFSQILADYIRTEIPAHRKKRVPKGNSITY
jgi:hypothetical protein